MMYVGRTYVSNFNKTPVNEFGLNLWRNHIVKIPNIHDKLLDTLLDLVHRERTERRLNEEIERISHYLDPKSSHDLEGKPQVRSKNI